MDGRSRTGRRTGVAVALLAMALLGAPRFAAAAPVTWTPHAPLIADDASVGNWFGGDVAISGSGTTAVVGAFTKTVSGHLGGAAYVFVKTGGGWKQQAELTSSDGAGEGSFGYTVGISNNGSAIVVGAPFKEVAGQNHAGAAYVFERSGTTWKQTAALTASSPAPGNFFGHHVAINEDGTTVAISAPSKNAAHLRHAGGVYVFTRGGKVWSQRALLTDPEPATEGYFGWAIAATGTQVLVGSPFHVNPDGGTGAVYGFDEVGGVYANEATLTAGDGRTGDDFGSALRVSGATMVVGAPYHAGPHGRGAVYVFTGGDATRTWRARAELVPSGGGSHDDFGDAVAISGRTVVIADAGQDVGSHPSQGVVYVFSGAGSRWSKPVPLTAADGEANDRFGFSVAASQTTVMVGEPSHDAGAVPSAGVVAVFGAS